MLLTIPILATGRQGTVSTFTRAITIDHLQVPSTQTDFPILVSFTDATFKTVANGGHIQTTNAFAFYSDSAGTSLLKWEVERYNATTGEIVAWVKIPSVSSVSDTVFYLRYGLSISTDQSDPTNVWTNSFLAVYHLKDGTTLSVASSTGSNNGTNNNATATTGQIDGAGAFSGGNTIFVTCGNGMNPTAMTISGWVNASLLSQAYNTLAGRIVSGSQFVLYVKSNGKLACYASATGSVSYDGTGSHTLVTGTWYYLSMTYNSSAGLVGYVDGASDGTGAANGNLSTTAAVFNISKDEVTTGRFWTGSIDEVKVSSVARSADWITVEYANQKPSANLVALGGET